MSKFEFDLGYINVLDACYKVDSVRHEYDACTYDPGYVKTMIEAHVVDKKISSFEIEKVIFNDPATIVFWADGTKTVVKCGEEDVYDYQTGLLMCIAKKAFGNKGKFNDILREWIPEEEEELTLYDAFTKATVVFNSLSKELVDEPEVKNDGWIPCSERLPEEDGLYLVTRETNPEATLCRLEKGKWKISSAFGYVLAWMPLPDIYKGE